MSYISKKKKKSNVTLHKDSVALSVGNILMCLNLREAMGTSKAFTELSLESMRGVPKKRVLA